MEQENLQNKIAQLRDVRAAGQTEDAERLLAEIVGANDPRAVPLLLTMRPYTGVDDLDEMWTITHAVEGYPRDVYLDGLANVVGEICRSSPLLAENLVKRVIVSDEYATDFMTRFGRLSDEDRGCLRSLVDQILKTSVHPKPNCQRMVDALSQTASGGGAAKDRSGE